ncbi:30S ribosomal protein S24e [Methanospirillum stamsii]|uniref:Small ribosomal subunit protein eS24 n=2 Tax=Methanospirillum stamsii TaxID=1277351 RepID=A0A2V2NJZ5_9EURY|nr:30S ribosomal protein S24e [Methanospirillum stamsii]
MEITITSDIENTLLNRRELTFSIVFNGATPSRKMIHAKLAAMVNAPKNQLVIGSLSNRFGLTQVSGDARVYTSPEDMKKIELDYIVKRGMSGEEETSADAQDAPSGDAAEAS